MRLHERECFEFKCPIAPLAKVILAEPNKAASIHYKKALHSERATAPE